MPQLRLMALPPSMQLGRRLRQANRQTEVERNGKIERETRYYLCSLALCALTFARVVPAHWGWRTASTLGVGRDLPRRPRTLPDRRRAAKQAIIRHTTLNALTRQTSHQSENRRKRAGWNVDYLETLIRQTA